mmetsp:Transcript_42430/g.93001  ORF Transcript_42430/g.93001 Transcript_42430/m.93001 type:complete len:206 (-) Transcript_42430:35-652(-)
MGICMAGGVEASFCATRATCSMVPSTGEVAVCTLCLVGLSEPLNLGRRSIEEVVLCQLQDFIRHKCALRPHHHLHVVDQEHRRKPLDRKGRGDLRLLVRVDLEHTAAIAKRLRRLFELRRHQLARAAPRGEDVDEDGRRAVLNLLLKLRCVNLADETHGRRRCASSQRLAWSARCGTAGNTDSAAACHTRQHGAFDRRQRQQQQR